MKELQRTEAGKCAHLKYTMYTGTVKKGGISAKRRPPKREFTGGEYAQEEYTIADSKGNQGSQPR